jgi:site-specific recombinase XerD
MQLTLWTEAVPEPSTGVYRRPLRGDGGVPAARATNAAHAPRGGATTPPTPGAALRPTTAPRPTGLGELDELAEQYVQEAHAAATRRAYQSDLKLFEAWCVEVGLTALPASQLTLERYLAHLAKAGRKASTIRRARSAIGMAHAHAGLPRPDQHARIRALERGIGRTHGAHEEGAEPLMAEDVARIGALPARTALEVRDRALVLVGFAAAFRASDLVRLDVSDVRFTADELELTLRTSKEDPLNKGTLVRIARGGNPKTCPVQALRAWIQRVGRPSGPLFRAVHGAVVEHERLHPRAVTRAVQRAAMRAGIEGDYSSHSLRAGLATSAYAQGARETDIRDHGRWQSLTSLARYIRLERIRQRPNPARRLL